MVYLDVTENWQITNDIGLNTNLTATITTTYGNTREIKKKIRDNIRQGGVLSVLVYAAVMDEIAE